MATADVLSEGAPTIAKIVERAGVSRSTFYEFFDSPEHVLTQLEQRVLKTLDAALNDALSRARTPLERVRSVTRSWVEVLEAQRTAALVALTRRIDADLLSPAGQALLTALTRVAQAARHEGAGSLAAADEVTLLGATAAIEAVSRRHLRGAPLRDAPRVLSDLISKLLR